MTLQDRIQASQSAFNAAQARRTALIEEADNLLTEMNRLQGEYRVLESLITEENEKKADEDKSKLKKEG